MGFITDKLFRRRAISEADILEIIKAANGEGYTRAQKENMLKRFRNKLADVDNPDNYYVAAAYATIYSKAVDSRRELITLVDKYRSFWLVDAIVDQLVEDALSPDINTEDVLTITSENKEIQKEVNYLDKMLGFDKMAVNVATDILLYGEYTFSTELDKGSKGLINLKDNVQQTNVIAIESGGERKGYIVRNLTKAYGYELKPLRDYVKFMNSSKKVKIDLFNEWDDWDSERFKEIFKDVPRYVRVGKSIVFASLQKIQELEILEKMVPASKLTKLSSGSIVSVQVPSGYKVEDALDAAQQIEEVINRKATIDQTKGEYTLENIMQAAGKIKVVPVFGDKGQLNKMDYKPDEPDDMLNSIEDIRRACCTSMGVPYEILFGGDGPKGEILKRYARYVRKLKNIQKSIREGIEEIIFIHLAAKKIAFKREDIIFEFRNKLVSIDNLDALEFVDASVSMFSSIKSFIEDLSNEDSPFKEYVRPEEFLKFLYDQFKIVGLEQVIDSKKLGINTDEARVALSKIAETQKRFRNKVNTL